MKKVSVSYFCLLTFAVSIFNVRCTADYDRSLGNNYHKTGWGVSSLIYKRGTSKGDSIVLLGEIVDYSFDDKFILVHRKVSDEVIKQFNDHPYSEITRGGDSIQYWIIQKQTGTLVGPFHKQEFVLKCNELKVPSNLQLKE